MVNFKRNSYLRMVQITTVAIPRPHYVFEDVLLSLSSLNKLFLLLFLFTHLYRQYFFECELDDVQTHPEDYCD